MPSISVVHLTYMYTFLQACELSNPPNQGDLTIGYVNSIPKMQFSLKFLEILSHNLMFSLTECVREFQNNALWESLICPNRKLPKLFQFVHSQNIETLQRSNYHSLHDGAQQNRLRANDLVAKWRNLNTNHEEYCQK